MDSLLDDSETQQQTKSVAQIVQLLTLKLWFIGLTDTRNDLNNEQNNKTKAHLEKKTIANSNKELGFLYNIEPSQLGELKCFVSMIWVLLTFKM